MKRSVIQQGGKTLMVSLPIKWAKNYNINKGDELELKIDGNRICFSASGESKPEGITVSFEGLSERSIRYVLSGLHKSGYDELNIFYDKQENLEVIEDVLKNLYVGFAIVDQSDKSCKLKSLSKELPDQFDTALRRAFLVTLSMGDSIIEAIEKGKFKALNAIINLEKTNNQLTNFCERLLNKYPFLFPKKQNFMYVVLWNLEKICDDYKYICKNLADYNGKISRELVEFFKATQNLLRGFYELFYKFSLEKLSQLNEEKKRIEQHHFKLGETLKGEELKLWFYLMSAIYKIVEFSASTCALRYTTETQQ